VEFVYTRVALLTVYAGDVPVQQFNTTSVVGTWTSLAVIRGSCQCVAVIAISTLLTVETGSVVLADTPSCNTSSSSSYNAIQYKTCNAPYVTRMLFV